MSEAEEAVTSAQEAQKRAAKELDEEITKLRIRIGLGRFKNEDEEASIYEALAKALRGRKFFRDMGLT